MAKTCNFSNRLNWTQSPVRRSYHVQQCCYCSFICCHTRVLDHHCWQHFHHIRVLEASQQTQANFLSSCQLSCCWSVCWIHRIISLGVFNIPGHLEETNFNSTQNTNISTAFEISFSYASVFFLALISLERACALIWPLRHRVASTKVFIYSAFFAWLAAVLVGTLTVVALYDILDYTYLIIAVGCVKLLCLVTICASYLVIRIRLNRRVPAIDGAHNIQQNLKLSRTLFIMITASLLFWVPSLVVYFTNVVCSTCVPLLVFQIFNLFRLANSLVNPIIYSFRIPMFRETFKRMKLCKQSKKYKVNYTPRNSIEDRSESALPRPQTSFVELSAVRMESWAGC